MRILVGASLLALLAPLAAAKDEATYRLVLDVGNIWGKSWITSVVDALSHLEGVKSAKGGKVKTEFIVEVSEKTSILPSTLEKAIPEKFSLNGVEITATGTVSKSEGGLLFTARGNGQKYALKPCADLSKLVDAGKTTLVVTGAVTEPEAEDGKKGLPEIAARAASEATEGK